MTSFDGLDGVIQLWFVALAAAVVIDNMGKTREVVSAIEVARMAGLGSDKAKRIDVSRPFYVALHPPGCKRS